jgi:uncharacterized protein (TIGR04141 family)
MAKKSLEPRTEHLHIFLLKRGLRKFSDAVKFGEGLPRIILIGKGLFEFEGELHLFKESSHTPKWLDFLRQGIGDLEDLTTRHHSAILFVQIGKDQFAIPFGYGHFKLEMTAVERDFGKRVVVNMVQAGGISSMSMQDFQAVSISRTEEATMATRLELFGANVEEELLNAIAGIPKDKEFAKQVAGSDGLKLTTVMLFDKLGGICKRLSKEHRSKAYLDRGFEWVDNLKLINDATIVTPLEEALVKDLQARNAGIQLSAPDDVRREDIGHFAYSADRKRLLHGSWLQMDDWYSVHGDKLTGLEPRHLKKWLVESFDVQGERITAASVFNCFIHEVQLNGERYILSKGKWYSVSKSFIKTLNDYLEKVRVKASNLLLPEIGKDEDYYIDQYDTATSFTAFHKNKFYIDKRPIEPCDLFDHRGKFVHVKCWTSSATFSHLLAQGLVSAQTCHRHGPFRKHMVKSLKGNVVNVDKLFGSAYVSNKFTVVFALLREEKGEIPFFSKLNLYSTGRRIENLGFQVEYHLLRPDGKKAKHIS